VLLFSVTVEPVLMSTYRVSPIGALTADLFSVDNDVKILLKGIDKLRNDGGFRSLSRVKYATARTKSFVCLLRFTGQNIIVIGLLRFEIFLLVYSCRWP